MPNQRRVIFFAVLIIALGFFAVLGYRYWYQPTVDFYNTDQASVTGSLVRVAAPASGEVESVLFNVGSTVEQNGELATIKVVAPTAVASAQPFIPQITADVQSPANGTVAERNVSVGDTVTAGQPIATIVDLSKLWVVVNANEARVADIQVGQSADVYVDAVNHTFHGQVDAIGSATEDLTMPAASLSFNTDSTKRVPVKIVFDYSGYRLVPGMSATVTIYTHTTR